MAHPRVSACFTHYNEWPVVQKALSSLLSQLPEDVEIVFVDAGSTDRSRVYLDGLMGAEPRFRLLVKDGCGRGEGRELAWRNAKAPITVHLDADRVWRAGGWREVERVAASVQEGPIRLEAPMRYHTTAGLVATRAQIEAVGGYDVTLQHYEDWDLERRLDARWGLRKLPCDPFSEDVGRKMSRPSYNLRYYYHMFRDAARTGRGLGHMVRPSLLRPWRYPFLLAGLAGFVRGRRAPPARSTVRQGRP